MKQIFLLFALAAFGILAWGNAELSAEMIASITQDVLTDFGTYHPYPATFVPNVPRWGSLVRRI
jgi:hypothetical protein